jgi:ABC-type microcin C transport system duplicated ATPase subunit YejF
MAAESEPMDVDELNYEEEEDTDGEDRSVSGVRVALDDDQEVPLSQNEAEVVREFAAKVKRMCDLEDQIKEKNAERKALNDEKNSLRVEVIDFMTHRNVDSVNYRDNEVLRIEERDVNRALTRKALLEAIKEFHEVRDVSVSEQEAGDLDKSVAESLYDAQELCNFIDEFLNRDKDTKIVLVREKRSKRPRKRPTRAPLSVFAPEPKKSK